MFSCTEGLIIAAIATAFILPSAAGESCSDRSGCPKCPEPLSSPAYCASNGSMFVSKSSICTCCDQCVPYISLFEKCRPDVKFYFKTIGGEVSSVTRKCVPSSHCDKSHNTCQ